MELEDRYHWRTYRVATPEGLFRLRGMAGNPAEALLIARWKLCYDYGYPPPHEQVDIEVRLEVER